MLKLIIAATLSLCIGLSGIAIPGQAADDCVRSWSPKEYKSFGQVQSEVLTRHIGARIISVQLCGRGAGARIRVTIDNGHEIQTVTINAK
jgi:hypothetical protein